MYKERYYRDDLENLSEEILFEQLTLRLEQGNDAFCRCDVCIQDIAAIALNHMPPAYVSSFIEKHYKTDETRYQQLRQQAQLQLDTAIELVRQHPHH